MEQLSLPFRVALAGLVVLVGLWFAVLRPKSGGTPATTPAPGVTGLANDVSRAKGAVDATNAATARSQAAADGVGSTGAGTAATAPATRSARAPAAKPKPTAGLAADAAHGDPSRPLLAAVDAGKVAVVLFWNPRAADDRATRDALRAVDRHHGKVVTRAVPIAQVGRYEAITRGAQVLASPTVLVIGVGGKARAITGFTQAREIDQAVSDIGGSAFSAEPALAGFAKVADTACRDTAFRIAQGTAPPRTRAELSSYLAVGIGEVRHMRARVAKAPAASATARALKSALVAAADDEVALAGAARVRLAKGADAGTVLAALIVAEKAASQPLVAAARRAHASGCYVAG